MSNADTPTPQSIGSAISQAQQDTMNVFFTNMQKHSVSQKSERDFYATIFSIDVNDPRLGHLSKDKKPPRVVKITNGINISGQEANPITVRLGRDIGTVEIVGMKDKSSSAKSAGLSNRLNELLQVMLPSANAGFWDWVIGRGLGRYVEAIDDIWESASRVGWYSNAERAALLAKGTAHMAAEGAIVGCVVGMHFTGDSPKLGSCAAGAGMGAAGVTALAGTGVAFISAGVAVERAGGAAFDAYHAIAPAKRLAFERAMTFVGKAGVAAAVAHGVDSMVKSDGVKLKCLANGGYSIQDLSVSDREMLLFWDQAGEVHWWTSKVDEATGSFKIKTQRSVDGIVSYLDQHENYKTLTPDSKQVLAKSILADLDRFAATCKKHGTEYTEIYRVEFDKPSVKAGQPSAKENKTGK